MNKFLKEILEQPESFNATLDYYAGGDGETVLKKVGDLYRTGRFQQIFFTGMGSSYFTSYAASCLFNSLGIRSFAVNTSELLYYHFSSITEKTLLVCSSQSGESIEVVKLLDSLPKNVVAVGVTNEATSSLRTKAREVLLIKAGREEMTSTKTYTSTTLLMFILGWSLAGLWGKEQMSQIRKLATDTEEYLAEQQEAIKDEIGFLGEISFLQFIGRGPSYATALQSELMIKEAAKIPSAGALGGEFRHGPMEMVGPGFKSVLFAADGKTYAQSVRMAADIAKYDGKAILIANKDPQLSNQGVRTITIPQADEYLFSIQSIIPVQLMTNHLAVAGGYDAGTFVHGGKVTLKE
ncbi:MAG TPA: SIS domain-containing protein [Bacteroidota bacterium]|nr:SIS domain-containing protein [Bacteroidota bacterium]